MEKDTAVSVRRSECSKADRKEVIKLAKSLGFKWQDEDRFSHGDYRYIAFYTDLTMMYTLSEPSCGSPFSIPEDMDKLKEALGVEVPKDGEVFNNEDRIVRFKNSVNDEFANLYSQFLYDGTFYHASGRVRCMKKLTKATQEETTKLIEAEHSNGYHWDGKELVEIPEYIERIGIDAKSWWHNGMSGTIFPVVKVNSFNDGYTVDHDCNKESYSINFCNSKPSTREAYETQNMVRLMSEKAHKALKKIGEDFVNKAREFDEQFSQYPTRVWNNPLVFISSKKPTKRIILDQYEAIEILVDEFEMVHGDGKILLTGKNK